METNAEGEEGNEGGKLNRKQNPKTNQINPHPSIPLVTLFPSPLPYLTSPGNAFVVAYKNPPTHRY